MQGRCCQQLHSSGEETKSHLHDIWVKSRARTLSVEFMHLNFYLLLVYYFPTLERGIGEWGDNDAHTMRER